MKLKKIKDILCDRVTRQKYDHWRLSGICISFEEWCTRCEFCPVCTVFLVRDVIYTYICYDVSVRLSVRLSICLWWKCIGALFIANLGFKFRSKFTADCGRSPLRVAVHAGALWSRCMPGRGEGSSCAMLATARPSCCYYIMGTRYSHLFSCCFMHMLLI